MDMLDLDKLNKESHVFERITEGTVDETSYNAVTQCINESVINNTRSEVEGILSRGNYVNDRLDFADLERSINGVFDGMKSSSSKVETDTENESVDDDTQILSKGECINPKIQKGDVIKKLNESNSNITSSVVDSAEKFLKAPPVNHTEFITSKTGSIKSNTLDKANTNTEHNVTEYKSNNVVERQSDVVMKEMQKSADSKKEFIETSKTQADSKSNALLKQNADKYSQFVRSLKTDENATYIDGILEAFELSIKSLI